MWTRLFDLLPKLLEALPHLDRFSSVADRLLTAKSDEDAQLKRTLETLHVDLDTFHADLNRIDATHVAANAVLTSRFDELSANINATADDARASRSVTVALGHSIVAIERQLRALRGLLVSTLILLVILVLMLGWLVLIHSR